ncbi:MAG: HypC/HybG/HupF family hydrogenase formation chaperone [Pseudomonadota bacterium]
MCLAVPARVTRIIDDETCVVDLGGIQKEVSTALVDDVAVDEYLVIHVGFALGRIDAAEAEQTLALLELQAEARDELTEVGA